MGIRGFANNNAYVIEYYGIDYQAMILVPEIEINNPLFYMDEFLQRVTIEVYYK